MRGRVGGREAGPLTVGPPEAPPPEGLLGDVGDADVLAELSVFALQEVRQVVHLQSRVRFHQVLVLPSILGLNPNPEVQMTRFPLNSIIPNNTDCLKNPDFLICHLVMSHQSKVKCFNRS